MQVHDLHQRVETIFSDYFRRMGRNETVLAEKGDERLRIITYLSGGQSDFPLQKATFMILENGWVWNKDDRTLLDRDEILVGSFIPADTTPLPFLAIEASIHFGKYDHLNVDLFPLSKNQAYRDVFCKPVRRLRKKNDDLPGLLPGVRTPSLLGEYTSEGMFAGDISDALRDRSFPWWFEYIELYKDFLEKRETYPVLKDPAIIEEARTIKSVFLSNYRKETPRILSDIPHLYSEEKGRRLGELLF